MSFIKIIGLSQVQGTCLVTFTTGNIYAWPRVKRLADHGLLMLAATREEKTELQKRRSGSISLIDVRLNRERLIREEVNPCKIIWVGAWGEGVSSPCPVGLRHSAFTPLIPGLWFLSNMWLCPTLDRYLLYVRGDGPRSRSYGRTAALRLIAQPCDEDEEKSDHCFLFPCNGAPVEWNW
jgi:hypothetical protein